MLLSPRKNALASLFKEVRVFKVFDLHVSVSCLSGPKDADHLSDHARGKNFRNNVSVRFYSRKLLF